MLEALAAGARVEAVYADEAAEPTLAGVREAASMRGAEFVVLAAGVLARVADAATPQPVAAVAELPLSELGAIGPGFVLVLCDVADPGNLGTSIRSADASGCAGVVVCGDAVDVTNPKSLRASAGSVFHLPVVELPTLEDAAAALRLAGRSVHGTTARGGEPLWTSTLDDRWAVVVGSEARGLGAPLLGLLDGTVSVPMTGRAESLNVGVAASIVCFEALRRRLATAERPGPSPTI